MKMHKMWHEYPELEKELAQVIALMEDAVHLKNKEVEQRIIAMLHSGGKLLRPAYQLLFARFGQTAEQEKKIALAAAVEMLHVATLIHDDVIDKADVRRGQSSIQKRFGNQTAVYAGDYLFVTCFKLLAHYGSSLKSLQMNSKSMETILDGELGQMDNRYQTNVTVETYIETISGKTAELFSLSCFMGAYENGASKLFAKACGTIGKKIGLAFQIMDDVLDYTETANQLGKPVLNDVKQGIYSLPLLLSLKKEPEIQQYLEKKSAITEEELQNLYKLIQQSGGIQEAKKVAQQYTVEALRAIDKLKTSDKTTKTMLKEITKKLLQRTM